MISNCKYFICWHISLKIFKWDTIKIFLFIWNPIPFLSEIPWFLCPWGFSRQEYWNGLPCPPSGIKPNPGIKPKCFLHCRQSLYHLSHQGTPRILEWVTYPFSRANSWPRNQTGIFCTVSGLFISWAIQKALRIQTLEPFKLVFKFSSC